MTNTFYWIYRVKMYLIELFLQSVCIFLENQRTTWRSRTWLWSLRWQTPDLEVEMCLMEWNGCVWIPGLLLWWLQRHRQREQLPSDDPSGLPGSGLLLHALLLLASGHRCLLPFTEGRHTITHTQTHTLLTNSRTNHISGILFHFRSQTGVFYKKLWYLQLESRVPPSGSLRAFSRRIIQIFIKLYV